MKNLFTLCILPILLFGGGVFIGYACLKKEKRIEIPMVEELKVYFTNESVKLKTVYVPVAGDTARYTNLYTNTIELYRESTNLLAVVESLSAQIHAPRIMVGGGYSATGFPLTASAGVEWENYCITAAVGMTTNWMAMLSSVNFYWRF